MGQHVETHKFLNSMDLSVILAMQRSQPDHNFLPNLTSGSGTVKDQANTLQQGCCEPLAVGVKRGERSTDRISVCVMVCGP